MGGRPEVVVVGAGHNGLAAAAYLAAAGRSVLVVERSAVVGGTAVTEEIAPGFRASTVFPSLETLHPAIVRELRLLDHGLELLPAGGTAIADGNGRWARFDGGGRPAPVAGNGATGPALPSDESDALAELEAFVRRIAGVLEPLYLSPLPDLDDVGASEALDLLRVGWRLRRLGRRDMREAMRQLPMALRDVLCERFDDPLLLAALGAQGMRGTWLGPFSAGSTFALVHHLIGREAGLLSGPVYARGGSGSLGEALAAAARGAGATIRLEAEAARITRGPEGAVVVLGNGEEIRARAVVSDADPRRTYLSLIDPALLDPQFVHAARGIRARAGVAIVGFALEGVPAAPAGGEVLKGRIQLGASLEELERAFDDGQRGRLPRRPFIELHVPSAVDPGLAPEGKHVATAWVQTVPYRLGAPAEQAASVDGWSAGRDRLAEIVTAAIDGVLPGFGDLVAERTVVAPPDLESRYAATNGCLNDVDLSLDQALYLRPMAGWAGYRAPVRGVYLCGSGTHGGGGIRGTAGRNAARQVLADLADGRLA